MSAVTEGRIFKSCVCSRSHFFSFIKSGSLTIRSHVPSKVGSGNDGLTTTQRS